MKFARPMDEFTEEQLKIIENSHCESNRTRNRAKAIRLSSKGFKIDDIATICDVCRLTVSTWIDNWDEYGFCSLTEAPGRGRKPIIDPSEYEQVIGIVREEPRQPKRILALIEEKMNKSVSIDTLKRIMKKNGFSWRRVRKSLKSERDEEEFRKASREIEFLKQEESANIIDLYYFDESGVSLVSDVPYAWQEKDNPILLPCSRSKRINILGFINRANDFHAYTFEGSVTSEVVTACFDSFCRSLRKPAIVIVDNAPVHTSGVFLDKIDEWGDKGLFIYNIPKYSPELNKIEILWKMIKYYWLPFTAYTNFKTLKEQLDNILIGIGSKYKINFA